MTDYDFRNLSPIDFEALIRDLIGAEEDILLETFAVGPDGGIDCRFQDGNRLVVVQCKHRPGASKAQIKKSARIEIDSLSLVQGPNKISSKANLEYHFVTSADLSPIATDEITGTIQNSLRGEVKLWSKGSLNALIARHNKIERRHFKLWLNSVEMLNAIMGIDEWRRNESLIHSIKTKVSIYVDTPKFGDAVEVLSKENVAIISGAPGVGKSTLAEMLLLTHWEAGWKVVDLVNDISGAWAHMASGATDRTIFYYDDFLGQTSSIEMQKNESGDLGRVVSTIRSSTSGNYKLVMTTREQILNAALSGPDDRIRNAVKWIDKIRIDLTQLSRSVKAKMLFNHLYFSYESDDIRAQLSDDPRYLQVIDHRGFNPRILESVVLIKRPGNVESLYGELIKALDRPDDIWLGSFDQLSALAVRILIHLSIRPDRAVDVGQIELVFADSDPREFTNALRVLEDTWIKIEESRSTTAIRLYDPSRKDFLLGRLDETLMARQAVRDANSLGQIEFVLKHLGRDSAKRISVEINREVEARALDVLSEQVTIENERGLWDSGYSVRPRADESIASVLSSCCAIVAKISVSTQLKAALERATCELEHDWPWRYIPDIDDLFDLADSLANMGEHWALKRGVVCAQTAIDGLASIEDLERLIRTKELFEVVASVELAADDEIQQVLDDEVHHIGQQDDRDLMQHMLDDIEDFAGSNGYSVDLDSAYIAIDSLPRSNYAGRDIKPVVASEELLAEDSDESISALFARLRD